MSREYPSNFDTPAFPAGKSVALARFMAIASCVMFLLVIFMCGLVLWGARSQRIDPFIVSIDNLTGQWTVVGHSHENGPIEYSALESIQESVIGNFAADWFAISGDDDENNRIWKTCDRDVDCGDNNTRPYGDKTCELYCISGEDLFSKFVYDVIPDYQMRVENGERWIIDKSEIQLEPAGDITVNGGTWRMSATIQSNINGDINIVAFIKVARNTDKYSQTLGYYVADFNAYKIN